jgi:hypothetical protein
MDLDSSGKKSLPLLFLFVPFSLFTIINPEEMVNKNNDIKGISLGLIKAWPKSRGWVLNKAEVTKAICGDRKCKQIE